MKRVAIAHDYLTQRGGAERVVLALSNAFPDAEIHTLFYAPDQTYPEFRDRVIRTSGLNRVSPFRRDPRTALPVLAAASGRMKIDADIVIASSSGWSHGFQVTGRKIIYCHSPARWLYLPDDYFGASGAGDLKRLVRNLMAPMLIRWDKKSSATAHRYLANSTVVRERIRAVYGIDADVIFPPFNAQLIEGGQEPISAALDWGGVGRSDRKYFLVVSRLQPYKHVDRVVDAFRGLPEEKLLVIGRGPEGERLQRIAPENVAFATDLTDGQMRWAYGNAAALIAASHEDFGLTPLEAGAHGVPTLALRAGGYLDTVTEGINGFFFDEATPEAIRGCIRQSSSHAWDEALIRKNVQKFSEEAFVSRIRSEVDAHLRD